MNLDKNAQNTSGVRFRQRKISVKQSLTIYNQKDLFTLNIDSNLEQSQINHLNPNLKDQHHSQSIETGVDKNEEDEFHLQKIINDTKIAFSTNESSQNKNLNSKNEQIPYYIPTPDATRIWSHASEVYHKLNFEESKFLTKFGSNIEDLIYVGYNMDEIDENFLINELNKSYPILTIGDVDSKDSNNENTKKCSELEFETIFNNLEMGLQINQSLLKNSSSDFATYEKLLFYILEIDDKSINGKDFYIQIGSQIHYISSNSIRDRLANDFNTKPFLTLFNKDFYSLSHETPRSVPKLFELFGEPVYNHWKSRRLKIKTKNIYPTIKSENLLSSDKENELDPYICFRRREYRQTRKTRRVDSLSIKKMRLLQKSLHKARDIIFSVVQREILKSELFNIEFSTFKIRCNGTKLKRVLGITNDDYLYYSFKKKLFRPFEFDNEKNLIANKKKSFDTSNVYKTKTQKNSSYVNYEDENDGFDNILNQHYVKLSSPKVPRVELFKYSSYVKRKNEALNVSLHNKIQKLKEQDMDFINFIDDSYMSFFNFVIRDCEEPSHIPYFTLCAYEVYLYLSNFFLNDSVKKLIKEGSLLPGVKTISGLDGDLVLSSYLPLLDYSGNNVDCNNNSTNYIHRLLNNIKKNDFSCYNNDYFINKKNTNYKTLENDVNINENTKSSYPFIKIRKRYGRLNRVFVDRKCLINQYYNELEDLINENDDDLEQTETLNVYDSKIDLRKRLKSRWMFDNDLSDYKLKSDDVFNNNLNNTLFVNGESNFTLVRTKLISKSYKILKNLINQQKNLNTHHKKNKTFTKNKKILGHNKINTITNSKKNLGCAQFSEDLNLKSKVPTQNTTSNYEINDHKTNKAEIIEEISNKKEYDIEPINFSKFPLSIGNFGTTKPSEFMNQEISTQSSINNLDSIENKTNIANSELLCEKNNVILD